MNFRQAHEKCRDFLQSLRKIHDSRLLHLKAYMEKTLDKVESDNVLLAMKDNPELDQYTAERIQEIVTNCIATEKEIHLHHLMEELAMARQRSAAANSEIQRLSKSLLELRGKGNELVSQLLLEEKIISEKDKEIEELKERLVYSMEMNKSINSTLKIRDQEYKYGAEESQYQVKDLIQKLEETYSTLEGAKLEKMAMDEKLAQSMQSIAKLEMENNELRQKLKEWPQDMPKRAQDSVLSETVKLHKEQLKLNEERMAQEVKAREIIEERYKEQVIKLKELFDSEISNYTGLIDQLQEKRKKDKDEYERVRDACEEYEAKYKGLNKQLVLKENEIISLKMQLAAKITEVEEIRLKVKNGNYKTLEAIVPQAQTLVLVVLN
eukprot:TRINITY_DN16841_c0_g1_i1.p1 TRINITY_DN16841_c0_g1~~TRINITY_DN16841_c0_g1_i1.p1  ORF type:complete len:380 (-),score=94.57 TRINITY_DN16841_c0_g1_i1:322-1461(-)